MVTVVPATVMPFMAVLRSDRPVEVGVSVIVALTAPEGPVSVGVPKVTRKPVPVTTAVNDAGVVVESVVADWSAVMVPLVNAVTAQVEATTPISETVPLVSALALVESNVMSIAKHHFIVTSSSWRFFAPSCLGYLRGWWQGS